MNSFTYQLRCANLQTYGPQSVVIIQVGCGGTGSLLVPLIARMLHHRLKLVSSGDNDDGEYGISNIPYILIDGDLVEEKNVLRQNFTHGDVGRYKSEVLANRYGQAFGVPILAVKSYFNGQSTFEAIHKLCGQHPLVYEETSRRVILVSCVDNNATRNILQKFMDHVVSVKEDDANRPSRPYFISPIVWIDAGNEYSSGQVCITGVFDSLKLPPDVMKSYGLPRVSPLYVAMRHYYPEIMRPEDKRPDERSCAEAVQSGEQSLAVNNLAATLIFCIVSELFEGKSLRFSQVMFNTNGTTRKMVVPGYALELQPCSS